MIPNYKHLVEQAKNEQPAMWANAHTGNAHTEDFIRYLAKKIQAVDKNCGLNGKRGNPNDISDDALNFLCDAADSAGRTPEGLPCAVIDCIFAAGAIPPYTPSNPAPAPTWNAFTTLVEGSGAHVDPNSVVMPPAPALKPRAVFASEFIEIDRFYGAPEGLQRVGGMVSGVDASVFNVMRGVADGSITDPQTIKNACAQVLGIMCDVQSMNQWGYDLMAGATVDQVKTAIRQSDEYKNKHPNG